MDFAYKPEETFDWHYPYTVRVDGEKKRREREERYGTTSPE